MATALGRSPAAPKDAAPVRARVTGRAQSAIAAVVLLLVAAAWPGASGAEDGLFAEPTDGRALGGAPLRLAAPPLAWGIADTEAAEDAGFDRSILTLNAPDGEGPPTGRAADAPPPHLTALKEAAAAGDATAAANQDRHWSSLPFLGDLAREAGYALPLPFGASLAYNYVARDIEVTDVRVGVDGARLSSVSHVANFKARSVVDAGVLKLDAWLLPFLNVYVIGGYIFNDSDVNIRVTVPRPGPLPGTREFLIKAKTELEGFVGGGGLSLAGGYRQFFGMVDINYSQADMGFDDRFHALIASGRVGWSGTVGAIPFRLWTGAAYWGTKNTAKGTVEVPEVGTVRFEADQGPKHPWNAVVGVSSALHRHFELFAEYGFNFSDVQFFAGGLTIRF